MGNTIKSFRDLIVWQKSMKLTQTVYKITDNFSKDELFVLTSQIRRSVISIPSNIAEGSMRGSRKEYANFLKIALGSAAELATQVEISYLRKYIKMDSYMKLQDEISEVSKILRTIIKKLNTKS